MLLYSLLQELPANSAGRGGEFAQVASLGDVFQPWLSVFFEHSYITLICNALRLN